MPDPLLPLLATIERLDQAATKAPWHALGGYVSVRDPETITLTTTIYHLDELGQRTHASPFQAVPFARSEDAAAIAFSRNTLAPLASMLRTAVEALETIGGGRPSRVGAVEADDGAIARAALATIRRMAEEVEGGQR